MKYLLDTHIWLWSLLTPEKLRTPIVAILEDKENELFISPITVWETLVLVAKGRIELTSSPNDWIVEALEISPVKEVPLSHAIAMKSRAIDLPHQDPADRFIAATAWEHNLILITEDEKLQGATQIKLCP